MFTLLSNHTIDEAVHSRMTELPEHRRFQWIYNFIYLITSSIINENLPFQLINPKTKLEVFRKDSKKMPIGELNVDFEETFYLNVSARIA